MTDNCTRGSTELHQVGICTNGISLKAEKLTKIYGNNIINDEHYILLNYNLNESGTC